MPALSTAPCGGATPAPAQPWPNAAVRHAPHTQKIGFAPVPVHQYAPGFARPLRAGAMLQGPTAFGLPIYRHVTRLCPAPGTRLQSGIGRFLLFFGLPIVSSRANVTPGRRFWRYQRACDTTLTYSGGKSAVRAKFSRRRSVLAYIGLLRHNNRPCYRW